MAGTRALVLSDQGPVAQGWGQTWREGDGDVRSDGHSRDGSRRRVAAVIVGLASAGLVDAGFRSLAANQQLAVAFQWNLSPRSLRLRVRNLFFGCLSLAGLAGAIRYAYRHVARDAAPASGIGLELDDRSDATGQQPVGDGVVPAAPDLHVA